MYMSIRLPAGISMTHIYAYTHMYMYISIYIYVCFGEHVFGWILQAMVVASGQPDAKSIARTLPRGMA